MPKGEKRKGGRPKGSKNKDTLEKERVLSLLQQRRLKVSDLLFDSQLSLARGQQYLFRIDKEWIATGKGAKKGYWKNKKPVLVTSEEEIRLYLEGIIEEGDKDDDQDDGSAYYYITTERPSVEAIKDVWDRSFGKPVNNIDLTSGGKPIPLLGNARHQEKKK